VIGGLFILLAAGSAFSQESNVTRGEMNELKARLERLETSHWNSRTTG